MHLATSHAVRRGVKPSLPDTNTNIHILYAMMSCYRPYTAGIGVAVRGRSIEYEFMRLVFIHSKQRVAEIPSIFIQRRDRMSE